MNKILEVNNLKVHFALKAKWFRAKPVIRAVDGVSFDVGAGETVAIVGESGCGKSSLARALVGLNPISAGTAIFNGDTSINLANASCSEWKRIRKQVQFIFQDPIAALNPSLTIGAIIAEPLTSLYPELQATEIMTKVLTTMKLVGLDSTQLHRYPAELSGGQCQRIGIARAIILNPRLLICDEAVSALDVSVKAQIINLLQQLQHQLKLTLLFISHDLSIVKHLSDRIIVMYLGNIMELGSKDEIFNHPRHPYTKALLAAMPIPNPHLAKHKSMKLLSGELPSPLSPPSGCVFNTRCELADAKCHQLKPEATFFNTSQVRCFKANL